MRMALAPAVPEDRARWQRDAGRVAAYGELRGQDDPTEALGLAPETGCLWRLDCYRAGSAEGRLLGARVLVLSSDRPRGRSAFMMASATTFGSSTWT